jgi:hypothetical protein
MPKMTEIIQRCSSVAVYPTLEPQLIGMAGISDRHGRNR